MVLSACNYYKTNTFSYLWGNPYGICLPVKYESLSIGFSIYCGVTLLHYVLTDYTLHAGLTKSPDMDKLEFLYVSGLRSCVADIRCTTKW